MRRHTLFHSWTLSLISAALCLAACAACAGELSDSVLFSSPKAMKSHGFKGAGSSKTFSGLVGQVQERMACWASGENEGDSCQLTLRKHAGQTARLQVQEVYPPDAPGTRHTYCVYANSEPVYIRDYPALMFSRVSYFVDLDSPELVKANKVTIKFVNSRKGSPFHLSAIWLYSDFDGYYRSANLEAPFYLTPLLHADFDKSLPYLKANIRPRPGSDVRLGCAYEHHYMNRNADATRKEFDALVGGARKYEMPLEIAFVSWWGGTPVHFPDGKGGTFSDPEYQQICWSETDNYDEGEPLKKLLGDKWDIRYGFTVPNRWSNTPWLTMNSPVLNAARHRVIGEHLGILSDILKDAANAGSSRYMLAIDMENEPRYWDRQCPDEEYPVKRKELMADFNPVTVAAAAADGVKLDPSDGLDYKERLWLHNNVARYMQETYNAHEQALKRLHIPFIDSPADSLWHEVYSHSFARSTFPMGQVSTYHPPLEWNRLHGCRAGLEEAGKPVAAYLDVTREWGRWSQVNYEENNGLGSEAHVRSLRACYAYGARFYTFYNWESINREDAWTRYVQEFCQDGPRTLMRDIPADEGASYATSSSHSFVMDLPPDWSTMNGVRVTLDAPGNYILTVYDGEDKASVLGYRQRAVSAAGSVAFDLPNSISIDVHRQVYLVLTSGDNNKFGLLTNPDGKPVVSLFMDAARERAQSLLICWRADAQSLISELSDNGVHNLDKAERLFDKGDYRRAYEDAAALESARK